MLVRFTGSEMGCESLQYPGLYAEGTTVYVDYVSWKAPLKSYEQFRSYILELSQVYSYKIQYQLTSQDIDSHDLIRPPKVHGWARNKLTAPQRLQLQGRTFDIILTVISHHVSLAF
jgi:hypothetical protein